MRTAQLRQLRIIKCLCAKARTIHAKVSKRAQLIAAYRAGIHLQRDFRVTIYVELTM
jgi:hypothetical protein